MAKAMSYWCSNSHFSKYLVDSMYRFCWTEILLIFKLYETFSTALNFYSVIVVALPCVKLLIVKVMTSGAIKIQTGNTRLIQWTDIAELRPTLPIIRQTHSLLQLFFPNIENVLTCIWIVIVKATSYQCT